MSFVRRRVSSALLLALTGLWMLPVEAQEPGADGALRAYLAVRVTTGGEVEEVDAANADRLFVPASVLKLVTVAAVLDHLGPEHRWVTRLTTAGRVEGAVLRGDLIVEPGGDPTWNTEIGDVGSAGPLADLAEQIRARGITRIAGDLVVDIGRFPGRMHPTDRSYGDLPYRFGTPPAPLALDDATISVRVAPGAVVGAPARIEAPAGVEVVNLTTTVGRDRHGEGTLDFVPVWGTQTLLLRGEYPISEPSFVVVATDPAPVWRAAARLRAGLAEAGVILDGEVRSAARSDDGAAAVLAEFRSRPLSDVLERVLRDSHNWTADMLVLTLGREVAGSGRFDDGVEVVTDFVERLTGRSDPDPVVAALEDGSGLSPANLITPRAVVRVLRHALEQPWGALLVGALSRPGRGTLESWPRLPPVAAKTGTLRHTVGLAGVLRPESGSTVLFCYLVNHRPGRPADSRREIATALGRW